MLVNNLQTIHQHHSARSSKWLCLFCQLVLKLCYVTPYSMLWMGNGSHRPIICCSSLQSMLGRCLPCHEGEGFIALLWLMGERQNDPDAKNRSKAMHFSLTMKPHVWQRKSTLSVMLLPGNSWREGTTRALPSHRLGRRELQSDASFRAGRQRRKQESRQEQAGHPHPTHSGGVITALWGVASVFGTALSRVASACTCFVCVVGRDWSINNSFHGEGQATHSGKQKLRWEIPEHLGANVNHGERAWQQVQLCAHL